MKKRNALRGVDLGTYGSFMLYSATMVATPMALLPMAEEFAIGYTGGGVIEFIRSFLVLIMLLFSGYAAARWGKIRLVSLGLLMISIGLLAYGGAQAYWMVLAAMSLIGLGGGFVEGLINPLVQDLHPEDAPNRLNLANAFFSLGVVVTVLTAGELLTGGASWRMIFFILGIAGLLLALLFTASGKNISLPKSNHSAFHIGQILKDKRFWLFGLAMFFGGSLESAFTFWSASYIQVYFGALPRGGGVGTALFAFGMAAGRIGTGRLTRIMGLRTIILISSLLALAVGVLAFFVDGIGIFFLLLFTAGLSVACFWPTIQAYAVQSMNVDSTLLFIYLSCFGMPGIGLTPVIMGGIADQSGLQAGFIVVPIFALLLVLLMTFDPANSRLKAAEKG